MQNIEDRYENINPLPSPTLSIAIPSREEIMVYKAKDHKQTSYPLLQLYMFRETGQVHC